MPANIGNQSVSVIFFAPANSSLVNQRFVNIRPVGIYTGGWLSKVSDLSVTVSNLVCEISDGAHQVRVQTAEDVTIPVNSSNQYVILRWAYTGAVSDYMQILSTDDPEPTDIIVGKCIFLGGQLTGFNYDFRSTPQVQHLYLRVEPSDIPEMRLWIRRGNFQTATQNVLIADQKSPLFIAPITPGYSRIDILTINSQGSIQIIKGTAAIANPIAPNYEGNLVLAEVLLKYGDTSITADRIRDVRPFLAAGLPDVDNAAITKNIIGKITVAQGGINSGHINPFVMPQMLPGWYTKVFYGVANQPSDFNYGDPRGRYISLGEIVRDFEAGFSFLYEMKVYNASGAVKKVNQVVRWNDNASSFYLNGTRFLNANKGENKVEQVEWNLEPGLNNLQVVSKNTGGPSRFILLGDIINNSDVYWVSGPVSE